MSTQDKQLLAQIAALSGAINRKKIQSLQSNSQSQSSDFQPLESSSKLSYKRTRNGALVRSDLGNQNVNTTIPTRPLSRPSTEERNLLKTIAALSGAINRKKIQTATIPVASLRKDKDSDAPAVKYRKTKRGLVRSDLPRQKRKFKKKSRPKRKFINKPCHYFTKYGKCHRGESCPCLHDKSQLSICKKYLSATCQLGENCLLSHSPTSERMPHCAHFQRGQCTRPDCPYTHVKASPTAPVCRDFAVHGYCPNGSKCRDRHVWECPDFAKNGSCPNRKCPMPHVVRRQQHALRKIGGKRKREEPILSVLPGTSGTHDSEDVTDGDFVLKPDFISLFIASDDDLESCESEGEGEEDVEDDEDEDEGEGEDEEDDEDEDDEDVEEDDEDVEEDDEDDEKEDVNKEMRAESG